jgi:peptidoglycan/LPS O-acetylase OafA/YrhL
MVFCRCCGKEIHESAPTCPQCGGLQIIPQVQVATNKASEPGLWVAITALTCAILGVLALMDDGMPDRDTTLGIFAFEMIGMVFGIVSIRNQEAGKKMAIASIVLSAIGFLMLIGMHSK